MTALEDAQVRVAMAQEARDKLHEMIRRKYGALRDLDVMCQAHNDPQNKNSALRCDYNRAVKELRLAKSDLARMQNEERQEPKEYEVGIRADEDGITLTDVPDELAGELTGGTGKVVEMTPGGDAVIELVPDRPGDAQENDEAAEKNEEGRVILSVNGGEEHELGSMEAEREITKSVARMMGKQLDLDGNPIPAVNYTIEEDTETDEKEYKRIRSGGLLFRVDLEWYKGKLLEKKKGERDEEHRQRMLKEIQKRVKHRDKTKPLVLGEFDEATLKIYQKVLRGAGYE